MKRARFSEEQIAFALRQVEGGASVKEVCRQTITGGGSVAGGKAKQRQDRGVDQAADDHGRQRPRPQLRTSQTVDRPHRTCGAESSPRRRGDAV